VPPIPNEKSIVPEPIISVSGLRGIVGQGLTPLVAARYACAFAAELPLGPIVVGRDGRPSGGMLSEVIRGALCAMGRSVIDAGIAATPTTGVLVRHCQAAGGLEITASHNPAPYNGMKLFGGDGSVISADQGESVRSRYEAGHISWAAYDRIGDWQACEDMTAPHCRLVLQTVNADRIRQRRPRVVLDSNHGAGSLVGKKLLDELGCQAILLAPEPSGQFVHAPEPIVENLVQVAQIVGDARADVGFCQDPDADRLAVIDETGRAVGEEYTLALCLDHVLRQAQAKGPVVTNCSTSRMSEDLATKYGVPFYRSKVGEAHVVQLMKAHHAVFGGEGNGGPIDPRVGYVRDSFVGMALVLDAMAARGMTLSERVAELPRYGMVKAKIEMTPDELAGAFTRLENHFSDARADRTDGLRLDWSSKWLLVRGSNTEPIARVIAEARSPEEAAELCDQVRKLIATGP
jgi:phosphomannomutase